MHAASVDAIVSEPPYHRRERSAVAASVSELARCLRPGGRLCLMLTSELETEVSAVLQRTRLVQSSRHVVRRQGMVAAAILYTTQ